MRVRGDFYRSGLLEGGLLFGRVLIMGEALVIFALVILCLERDLLDLVVLILRLY